MKLRVVAVGSIKPPALRELIDDYKKRLARYTRVEEVELKPAPVAKMQQAIERAVSGASVVALDVKGELLSSRQLADRLERLASRGKGVVALLIGGADGLPERVVREADQRWSLSALTLPHRLARLVLAEQLYRAMTILRGEPYDH